MIPFLIKKKLDHIVPYENNDIAINVYGDPIIPSGSKIPYKKMEAWRVNYHGVQARYKKTNFILYGSVDYIWLVYMANNIIDPYYEWPMNAQTFNDYMVDKYQAQSGRIGEDVLDWIKDESIDENIIYYIKTV